MSTTPTKEGLQVEGGTLKDRLALLEEQRKRDAAKLTGSAEKSKIVVEGGGLKDRLKLLEEHKSKKQPQQSQQFVSTDALIKERLKWMEDRNQQSPLEKAAIIVEGGGVKDRLLLLDYQRQEQAARLASKATDMSQVSDDIIRERLKWMDEQQQQAAAASGEGGTTKAAIFVEGGNLQERLMLLEEQRRRQAERSGQKEDLSHVSDDLIRERLQWMDQQQPQQGPQGASTIEANAVIKGGSLQLRKRLLQEQHRREAERLAVRRLVEVDSQETVRNRMQWLTQQQQERAATQNDQQQQQKSKQQHELMSNDLIAERLSWLKESAERAAQLPEKERVEVTNNLVQQRKAWLDEQMQKAAQLPPKERIEVSQGLIIERMEWLSQQMNRADKLSHKERTQMTTDLIAERLAYLEAQIQANAANEEAKANLEMQINFLEEQQQVAEQMTESEQLVMAEVLITEKMQDLEQQKELFTEISEDQQIEVTQALLEDRQAWLEGDQEHYIRKREEQKRAQEEAEARALEEQQTAARIAEEVANTVTFWTQQKENAVNMGTAERAQITAFLIAEHVVALEIQLEDPSIDEDTKASLEQQISFLNDQMEIVENIDHLMMIDVLVQEKIASLEKMLVN